MWATANIEKDFKFLIMAGLDLSSFMLNCMLILIYS